MRQCVSVEWDAPPPKAASLPAITQLSSTPPKTPPPPFASSMQHPPASVKPESRDVRSPIAGLNVAARLQDAASAPFSPRMNVFSGPSADTISR